MELKKLIEIAERNDEYELREYRYYDKGNKFEYPSIYWFEDVSDEYVWAVQPISKIGMSIYQYYDRRLFKSKFKFHSPLCYKIFKCKGCNCLWYMTNYSNRFRLDLIDSIIELSRTIFANCKMTNSNEVNKYVDSIAKLINSNLVSPFDILELSKLDCRISESFTPADIAQIIDLDKPELKLINSDPIGVLKVRRQYPSEDMIYVMEAYKFYNDIET